MKSSTLVFAATIATAIYAQNIPREKYSRKSLTSSNNKQVDVITGNGKTLRRQEAVSPAANGTGVVEVEEPEEEEEEEESESESDSDSGSSSEEEEEDEDEDEDEEEEDPEAETGEQESEPAAGEEQATPAVGQEAEAADGEEAQPAMEGGATSGATLIDGPSGQIAMGEGVTNADGSCVCNVACPAGSLPT